ncbi:uncharacterized protein ATNIH1004_009430 [Aspergillus tanneri]|uniref:DNA 3'-5' helicase n=1 Tax=Aspergillus tanneri TaxID=1220188 RepID=A0A5M9MJS2_9EURO|nr:uncharacterized protein ATNIH1004_009430 [Aspergillus tanneri]KAA8645213.1 hypothetical protein ATNIH1004_009430 [Aspergillus tanneri]
MIGRLRAEPAMQKKFTIRRQARRLHMPKVAQYLERVARFKEKLAVIVYVVSGQPARAPELLSIQHVNTVANRQRNIYIEDGIVALVTAYHKGFYASNDIKIIHRFVPREHWGTTTAQSSTTARKAPRRMPHTQRRAPRRRARTQRTACREYMQRRAPRRMARTQRRAPPRRKSTTTAQSTTAHGTHATQGTATAQSTTTAQGTTAQGTNATQGTNTVQSTTTAQGTTAQGTHAAQGMQGIHAAQGTTTAQSTTAHATHATQGTTAQGTHAAQIREDAFLWGPDPGTRRKWTSERFREVLKRETKTRLKQAINIQWYRDIAIGISRRFLRATAAFASNMQEERDLAQAVLNADTEEGGAFIPIGGWSVWPWYYRAARDHGTSPRNVSALQHRLAPVLGFASAAEPSPLGKRKRSPWEDEAEEGRVVRRHRLNIADMRTTLQHMTGQEDIQFRGVQAPALRAIQDGQSPVVAIMRTGGKKHVVYVTCIRRAQWYYHCGRAINIIAERYGAALSRVGRRPPDEATIVLVTPESAVQEDFQTFINRLQQTRRLDRIVIDECHVILNNQRDFRPELRQLGRLNHARTQMVLLTATLPPRLEAKLFRRMEYSREQVHIFRDRTSRPNVAYRVWRPELGRRSMQWFTSEPVLAFIRERILLAKDGKVVVYGHVVRQVVEIARELACEAYYSKQVNKPSILQRFTRGEARVITATSALGMGVDIPDIRSIIHIGTPRSLLEYGQETRGLGRAQPETPEAVADRELWTSTRGGAGVGCRRFVLDAYMDETVNGYTRRYCQDINSTEALCDGCDADWLAQESVCMSPDRYSPDTRMDDLASTTSPPREISATGSPHSHGSGELFPLSHIIPQSTQNIAPNPTRRSQSHDSTELFKTQVISHVIPQSTQNIAPNTTANPTPNPTPTVSIAKRQRQRVQDQRHAAPCIQCQVQDARQWLDKGNH